MMVWWRGSQTRPGRHFGAIVSDCGLDGGHFWPVLGNIFRVVDFSCSRTSFGVGPSAYGLEILRRMRISTLIGAMRARIPGI